VSEKHGKVFMCKRDGFYENKLVCVKVFKEILLVNDFEFKIGRLLRKFVNSLLIINIYNEVRVIL
jgi:hypothetical protein